MQIHHTTPTQTLRFNFASEAQRHSLLARLTQGQSLQARVLSEMSSGRWALRFMGHTLVAESKLALSPGQIVNARVEDLGPPLVLSLSGRVRSEQASLAQALQQLGLSADSTHLAVVRGLMAYGLAVDRQEVQALRDLLLSMGSAVDLENAQMLEEAVTRILFLQRQGIPVTPDTLFAYPVFVPPGVLGGLLEGLVGLLRSHRLAESTTSEFSSLADRIMSVLPKNAQFNGEQLRHLIDTLGVDLEGKLSSWIDSGANGLPERVVDSLRLALLTLKQRLTDLSGGEFRGLDRQGMGALSEKVGDVLQFLESIQISNLPGPSREALQLQIPLMVEDQMTTADLRIFYRDQDGRRVIDADHVHLSLAIELSGLGPIRLELKTAQNQAFCQIFAVDESRVEFLNGVTAELAESLAKCGYSVQDIRCQVERDGDKDGFPDQPPSVGVDFRV